MTYNIHYGIGTDDLYGLDRIIAVIQDENPDVVALQEVDRKTSRSRFDDQPKIIAQALDMDFHYGKVSPVGSGEYGIATLSRFPISEGKRHDLSFNPRLKLRFRPRGSLRTDISVNSNYVHVFNVHLGLGVRERVHQRRKLLSDSILLDRDLKDPIVVMGDFNDRPIPVVHPLLRHHFKDAFKASGFEDGATFRWKRIKMKLDHIYLSDEILPRLTYVVDTPASRLASDHRPLTSRIEVNNR